MGNRQLITNSTKSLGLQHFKIITTDMKKSIKQYTYVHFFILIKIQL